jgi:hypothetical protein
MRLQLLSILLATSLFCTAQTQVEKTIPLAAGQKLLLILDDPQVNIQTWDKKEVLIKGTVSVRVTCKQHSSGDHGYLAD